MQLRSPSLALAVAGAALWLQGCGGGDCGGPCPQEWPGPTAAPPGGKTPTTTPKPDHPPQSKSPTPPADASTLASELSEQFKSFDPAQDSGSMGVTITWLETPKDKKLNLYCPDVPGNDDDGCFDGSANCRMSAAQHTTKTAVQQDEDGAMKVAVFSKRKVGVVFASELVQNFFGKCAYAYDGSSNYRCNHGCGTIPTAKVGKETCPDPNGAYQNICKSSGKTCTAADPEVEDASCDKAGGHATDEVPNCFYKLPAYDAAEADILTHYTAKSTETNQLRTMMKDRVNLETQGHDCTDACWNEIIIDTRMLLTQLWWDPLSAVPAIVYAIGVDDGEAAPAQAKTIQAAFKEQWGVQPPILTMNLGCDVNEENCANAMFGAPADAIAT